MLDTRRLHLSIITADDFDDVYHTLNNQRTCEIISFLNWPLSDEQVQWWCDKAVTGFERETEFLFIARQDEKPAGCIGLHLENDKQAEVGYWVSADMQGQGIATEMLQAVTAYGFEALNLKQIYATTALDNPPSDTVLTKSRFGRSGQKDVELPDGTFRPSNLFMLKNRS